MTLPSLLSFILLIAIIPTTGGLLAATPWLMRRNECFAVTVPAGKQNDGRLVALKRRYTRTMLVVTAAFTALAAAVLAVHLGSRDGVSEGVLIALILAGTLVPLVVSFALMLSARRAVQKIKVAEGWFATQQQVTAVVAEEDVPGAISLAWNLLYVPIALASIALTYALYPSMPDVIPMQVNFSGEVTSTMQKGPGVFAFPLLFTAFLAAVMTFSHWTITRSKRPTDPGAPATSALAYGMFARAQSILMVATGLVLAATTDICFILSAAGVVSLEWMAALIVVLAMLIVVVCIAVSVVYGQAGSRLHARMQAAPADAPLAFDDDEHWILGIIYFNRDDASLFLPERFGIGWTLNMARPAAWVLLVGFVALTAVFIFAVFSLT